MNKQIWLAWTCYTKHVTAQMRQKPKQGRSAHELVLPAQKWPKNVARTRPYVIVDPRTFLVYSNSVSACCTIGRIWHVVNMPYARISSRLLFGLWASSKLLKSGGWKADSCRWSGAVLYLASSSGFASCDGRGCAENCTTSQATR